MYSPKRLAIFNIERHSKLSIRTIFLLFLIIASQSVAATIHVSISGNDTTGTGASASPYATIQKAVDVSQNGDTVLVAPGTYSGEGNRAINLRGKQITMRSLAGPVATVLDLGRQQGILALSTETLATVVDGFTFRNGYVESGEDWRGDGIISILGDAVITLKNSIFTANETKATYVTTSTGIVFKRNRSYGATALVQNCLFYGNTIGGGGWTSVGGGSAFVVGATGGEPLPKVIDIQNCTIANNTLYSAVTSWGGFSGGIRIAVFGAGVIDSTIVWGNSSTFFPATEWSSNSNYQSGAQTLLLGSVSYSISQNGVILEPAGSHLDMTWPAAVGSALTEDPMFVAPQNSDFSLSPASPAIDAGDPSTIDPDGSRSDIGFSLARAVASSEGNLLANGSFEDSAYMPGNTDTLDPAVDGWSGSGNFHVTASGLEYYEDIQEGQKALVFNAGERTPSGSIEQTVSVEPSQTYFLSFWLLHHGSDSSPGTLGIKAEIIQDGSVIAGSSVYLDPADGYFIGQWYPFSLEATSTGSTMTVRFTDISTSGAYQKDILLDNITLLSSAQLSEQDSDGDGLSDAWERGFGRYYLVDWTEEWNKAAADADAHGGHLATITSESEWSIVSAILGAEFYSDKRQTWLGGFLRDSQWEWVTGEQWSYSRWSPGEPNGGFTGFLEITDNGGGWNDTGNNDVGYQIPERGAYLLEFGYPTDPFNADSDGDGFNDSIETHYKTDPNNASVTPNNSRPTGVVSQWVAPEANQSSVPSGLTDVVQIAAGGAGYALKADGSVAAWGEIWSGSGSENIPAYVPDDLSNVVQVDAGLNYALALKGDGTLVTWGHFWDGNGHQAAFVPDGLSGVVQISAGISHAAALKADGTIVVWGTNNWGQTNVPEGLSNVVQVEAGGYHTMALKRDGTVVVWGGIHSEVRNIPDGLSDVVEIAAGGHVCVALKSDGTVVAWGSDNLGGIDVPLGLNGVVAISASPHVATIAVKGDGTAVSWGDQSNLPTVSSPILQADAGWGRNIVLSDEPSDSDSDGIPDNFETNTGTWVSSSDTGTDPNNADTDSDGLLDGVETNTGVYASPEDTGTNPNIADTDGDGLSDGVETASFVFIDATDTGTDPNVADTDGDGLSDGVETNTGVYTGLSNTGTNPLESDSSGDGLFDGDVVGAGYNPNTNYTELFNLIKMKGSSPQENVGLFTESSIMDLNLGGVTLRKSGSSVNLRLQLQTKSSLSNEWTNHSVVPLILDMPGNKGFMRVRALGPQ
jgi:hypothetical protein